MSIPISHKAVRIVATAFCTVAAGQQTTPAQENNPTQYIVIEDYNRQRETHNTHSFLDPVFLAKRATPTNTL